MDSFGEASKQVRSINVKGKGKETGRSIAKWDMTMDETFVDLCVREDAKNNRPNSHFNKKGWQNIVSDFYKMTGHNYDRAQLKNHWDVMKKEWQA